MRTIIVVSLAVLVGLGITAWLVIRNDPILMVKLRVMMRPAPAPTMAVHWRQGPSQPEAVANQRPPNIVVILADDLGFNDLTFGGGGVASGAAPTPRIDSIATEGAIMERGYAGNATCAPSRAAIMTGRYATRFGYEFTPTREGFLELLGTFRPPGTIRESIFYKDRAAEVPPIETLGMPKGEITIAQLLKTSGYHNVMLGKWHLGDAEGMTPFERGFDEALGFLTGASMFLPKDSADVVNSVQDFDPIDRFLWAALPFEVRYNNGPKFTPGAYMTDYLGDEAVNAIKANKNRLFFMYLAFNAPHTPLQAAKADYDALASIKDRRLRVYAAMIRALDRNVGKVLDALREQGLEENTLVIFTSDNGGAGYIGLPEINKPYRGWKATFFEGGIHVPYFVKWPAQIPKGARFASPVGHVDIFATAAAAAGAVPPQDRIVDGVDFIPHLQGKTTERPHKTMYWRSGDYKVLLHEDWKLQVSKLPDKIWLFNLADDPTEKTNLAASLPEKVAELQLVLAEIDAQQVKPLWPSLLDGAVSIDHTLEVPEREDDEYIYWAN
jgi:arylsulfatase A-like enzyme